MNETSLSDADLRSEIKEFIKYGEGTSMDESTKVPSAEGLGSQDTKLDELAVQAIETQPEPVSSAPLSPEELEKKRMRRFMVTQEIYDTEKGYVNDLNNLVRNLLDPLNGAYLAGVAASAAKTSDNATAADLIQNTTFGNQGGGGWLTFDQKQAIIRNASHILRVQKLFLKMIEDAVKIPTNSTTPVPNESLQGGLCSDPSVSQMAKCFLTMMPKLEAVYLPYCSQHDTAIATLAQIRKTHPSQLQAFLDECKPKMNTKLEIQDFLIKPVQRICKYPLLLNELLKGTPEGQDRREMANALEKIKQLVSHINEQKKIVENERRKTNLLTRLAPSNYSGLAEVGIIYGIQIELDARQIPSGQTGDDLKAKMGKLLRGAGLFIYDLGDHELPFATNLSTENSYHGVFLFPEVMLILQGKKSNSYPVIYVIPIADIVNIQDTTSVSDKTKLSWRITWQFEAENGRQYYHSVDCEAKQAKDKETWLFEMAKIIPAEKFQITSDLDESPAADVASRKLTADSSQPSSNHPTSAPTSPQEADMTTQIDLKFSDVYTTENSTVSGIKGATNTSLAQRIAKAAQMTSSALASSAIPSAANSASSMKQIFRRSSFSKGSTADRPTSASNQQGRSTIKGGARPDMQQLQAGDQNETKHNEPDDGGNNLGQRRSSISDMANAMKKLVRGRSNSLLTVDKDKAESKQSLAPADGKDGGDDGGDKDKKWGNGIKAKILTVGKFSSAHRKSVTAVSQDNLKNNGDSKTSNEQLSVEKKNFDETRKSNSSLAPSVADSTIEKKKGLFSSLGRSFSKRGKEKATTIVSAKDIFNNEQPKTAKDEPKKLENLPQPPRDAPRPPSTSAPPQLLSAQPQGSITPADSLTRPPSQSSGVGLSRRPGIRVSKKSDSVDSNTAASIMSAESTNTDDQNSQYTYKPTPPTLGDAAPPTTPPKNSSSAARISAIRAKRTSKRESQLYNDMGNGGSTENNSNATSNSTTQPAEVGN